MIHRSVISALLFGLVASVVSAQTAEDIPTWESFGHDRQWSVAANASRFQFLNLEWKQELGEGKSQIVGNDRALIVASGKVVKDAAPEDRMVSTKVMAVSTDTGKQLWEFSRSDPMHADQETFGGNKPSPQATPLLVGKRLIILGFTGVLFCLNANSGAPLWEIDLVQKFKATPVQFGFSASPVRVPASTTDFVVLAAGGKGGLIRLSALSGEVRWICPVDSFSYATPTWAALDGQGQWVAISRTAAVGISERGQQLWRSDLKEQGLTNVPSPLIIDEHHLLLSGQGMDGTQCLEIRLTKNSEWKVEQSWHNRRLQFFYTNWLRLTDRVVLGCTLQYLAAFDARSGEVLGRWRNYRDGNLIRMGNQIWLLDGKGKLTCFSQQDSPNQWQALRESRLTEERCWVAPSVVGDRLLVRHGSTVACYRFASEQNQETLEATAQLETQLDFAVDTTPAPDPVVQILEAFEQQGQATALNLYNQLRAEKALSVAHRIALTEAAYEGGLIDLATMIVTHAEEDFPESQTLKKQIAEWKRDDQ